ncbi:MAG: hypothetical protein AB1571_02175 [Nanoarchaeota archaeon]
MKQNKDMCKFAVDVPIMPSPKYKCYCRLNKETCEYSLKVPGFNLDEAVFCIDKYQTFTKRNEVLN